MPDENEALLGLLNDTNGLTVKVFAYENDPHINITCADGFPDGFLSAVLKLAGEPGEPVGYPGRKAINVTSELHDPMTRIRTNYQIYPHPGDSVSNYEYSLITSAFEAAQEAGAENVHISK